MSAQSHAVSDLLSCYDHVMGHLADGAGVRVSAAEAESAADRARAAADEGLATALERAFAYLASREDTSGHVTLADIEQARTELAVALANGPTFLVQQLDRLSQPQRELVDALLELAIDDSRNRKLVFWLNGRKQIVHDPDPRTLLLDYLRSPEVGQTGTKKVCAQGGCGACTVMLTRYDARAEKVESTAINSCLRPLCAVDGMQITTIEGIGTTTRMNEIQHQIAVDNGSQCGYCTPGWVMNMHSHLVANPNKSLNQLEIEQLFDGNLCRCTGFRPILYAMRHFASDWGPKDEKGSMKCKPWPTYDAQTQGPQKPCKPSKSEAPPVPKHFEDPPAPLELRKGPYTWLRVLSLQQLEQLLSEHGSSGDLRLVVGNTSIGIYGEPAQDVCYGKPFIRADISQIPELHGISPAVGKSGEALCVGAATTYTKFLDYLDAQRNRGTLPPHYLSGLEAIRYMAHRTAGKIVRDAASLGGNTMLVVEHVDSTKPGEVNALNAPFPSDMFTALTMMGAKVEVACPAWSESKLLDILDFAQEWQTDQDLHDGAILLRYHVPWTQPHEHARTFKVALREVNAHSIVNAGIRVRLSGVGEGEGQLEVESASVVYGGIGPIAFHCAKLENWMVGQKWNATLLAKGLEFVRAEVGERIRETETRMAEVPDEGFTAEYRTHLAESFFYQYFLWLSEQVAPGLVPEQLRSGGVRYERPVSTGQQHYQPYESEYPVNEPFIKAEAFMQATGEAVYTHDTPVERGGYEGAPVLSTRALANFSFKHGVQNVTPEQLAEVLRERFANFVELVTAADVPANNNQASDGPEDPLICSTQTTACGQVLAIVLASTAQEAINIAYWVQHNCVAYESTGEAPVLSLADAIAKGDSQVLQDTNIAAITRQSSTFEWVESESAELDGVACAVVKGTQESHCPQMHFYLETQSAVVTPKDNGDYRVLCSTQNPDTILGAVASALGVGENQVDVCIRRVGGGYGGKGPRSPWAAANAAIAAAKVKRPVKIAMTREADSALFGHENPLLGNYQLAIGTGADNPDNKGRIMGIDIDYAMNAGNTADCSAVVMDCTLLRADNGYYVPNYKTSGTVYLTNQISNTSFRSLDAVSGIAVLEDALEAGAHQIGMLPEDVRQKNLYRLGDFTPYGEVLEYCYLRDVWDYTREHVDFDARLAEVREFNAKNRWRKRGISMLPIKYGMGFNATFLERGDALVDIYDKDGTVIVRHGGCEIGQGVNTQVMQLVAEALNIPVYMIQVGTTSTNVIPNPISTGASTGTAFNGGAAQKAAQRLRKRLEAFCLAKLDSEGRQYCHDEHLDFWNYDAGWSQRIPNDPNDPTKGSTLMWAHVVSAANMERVNLSTQAQHNETGGERLDTGIGYQPQVDPGKGEEVQNFVGYTYSAACSEVEVDILTGEVTIRRSDVVYDMGKSINPATDVGQVEGAFVQGIGRVLLEDVTWQPSGELPGTSAGTNNTPNTWGYKIPATVSIPIDFRVDLYPRTDAAEVPENPNLLMSAKEVGEPPLCLAATVYFAVKHAVLDSRVERGKPGWFTLDMPCTVQRVREACEVTASELNLDPGR